MAFSKSTLAIEFAALRDSLVEAINEGKTARVISGLEVYKVAVEAFLSTLKKYGAIYDFESARREASSIEGGWPEIDWIKDDLRTIVDAAFRIPNDEIRRTVVLFPVSLAILALDQDDYYVFDQFLSWIRVAYAKSKELPDPSDQEQIRSLISSHLASLSAYYIDPRYRRARAPTDISRTSEFSKGIVIVVTLLLKAAFEYRDLPAFQAFAETLNGLFEAASREVKQTDMTMLQMQTQVMTGTELDSLLQRLELVKKLSQAVAEIEQVRAQAYFGIGCWIVQKHLALPEGIQDVNSYYDLLTLPTELARLTELFYDLWNESRGERLFRMDSWIMEESPIRQTVSIDDRHMIARFYCLRALEAVAGRGQTAEEAGELPLDPCLEYIAGRPDGELERALAEIETKRDRLTSVLSEPAFEAIRAFRGVLERAVATQKQREIDNLINASLDPKKVLRVRANVLKEWRRASILRRIIREYGHMQDRGADAPKDLPFWGFNVRDRKDVYVAGSRIHSSDWGEDYGRSIAGTENELVITRIAGAIKARQVSDRTLNVTETLDRAIAELSQVGVRANVLLASGALEQAFALQQAPAFKQTTIDGFDSREALGYYHDLPLFQFYPRAERGKIYVVDLRRLGTWHQYIPKPVFEDEEVIESLFLFYVKEYDITRARDLFEKQRSTFIDKETGRQKEEAEAIREVLQTVHLRILEQFEYKIDSPDAGVCLNFETRSDETKT